MVLYMALGCTILMYIRKSIEEDPANKNHADFISSCMNQTGQSNTMEWAFNNFLIAMQPTNATGVPAQINIDAIECFYQQQVCFP